MKSAIHAAARLALASGLVAGAWLVPSVPTLGVEPLSPAPAAAEPTIRLAQADASAERPVTYAAEQADRGEERYTSACEECHGEDLRGGLIGGAPLRGTSFEQKYLGTPASGLFMYMSTAMPPNAPGRYSASAYADLMAYILKRNGFKEGAPLPSNPDELDNLMLTK